VDYLSRVSIAFRSDGVPTITHPLDGRSGAMDPGELAAAVRRLADLMDLKEVDYVLGFPEGGSVPAFAFAHAVGRPLVLSTRLDFALPGVSEIVFHVTHSPFGRIHRIHGLKSGDRVVIVEDEVTSGGTLVSAVRALRAAGVQISQAGALLAVDDPAMWRTMEGEGISLRVLWRLPSGFSARPGGPPAATPSPR
jgi:adenine/guanine phosphoribosyltransferase-like PRPP-binding protein